MIAGDPGESSGDDTLPPRSGTVPPMLSSRAGLAGSSAPELHRPARARQDPAWGVRRPLPSCTAPSRQV